MARRRTKSLAATIAVLMMITSSLFAGTSLAQSSQPAGGDEPRGLEQAGGMTSDFLCKSFHTGQLRLAFSPACPPGYQLIVISQELPFDYCYSIYNTLISDDRANNTCTPYQRYVSFDDSSSFVVCFNAHTGLIYHLSAEACPFGQPVFVVDRRGDITKYACVEENLNPHLCDFFPAGVVQNEIRQLERIECTPFTSSCTVRIEFDGFQTIELSGFSGVDTSPPAIQAALEDLPSIGMGNVIVTALDPGDFWTSAADSGLTPEDESTAIRVEFTGTLGGMDIVEPLIVIPGLSTSGGEENTIVDGSLNSPGTSYVLPGGTVQIFEALPATDPANPATYGPEVTSGPQAVNAAGSFTVLNLLDGDYVVCATGTGAVAPSCEIVTVFDNSQTIVNNVDLPGEISAALTSLGTNEVQTYDDGNQQGFVTGGTYTITFNGSEPTTILQWDADAATVQTALNNLSTIGGVGGSVTVTGGPPGFDAGPPAAHGPPMVITFGGTLASQDLPAIVIDSTNLTGSGGLFGDTYFVNPNLTDIDGSGATHTLTADDRVSGGTFTLTYDNGVDPPSTTAALDFDATVTEIETALNALASITSSGGSVTVVSTDPDFIPGNEPITKAPVEVSFSGVANSEVDGSLTVDNISLE